MSRVENGDPDEPFKLDVKRHQEAFLSAPTVALIYSDQHRFLAISFSTEKYFTESLFDDIYCLGKMLSPKTNSTQNPLKKPYKNPINNLMKNPVEKP